jgi:hypothetical protein
VSTDGPSIRDQVWRAVDATGENRALINAVIHGSRDVPDFLRRIGLDVGESWGQLAVVSAEYRKSIEGIEAAVRALGPRGWCGVQLQRCGCDQAGCRAGRIGIVVVRTLGFLIVRRMLGLIGLGPAPDAKDVEIAVLRHQLVVLRRQVAPPSPLRRRPARPRHPGRAAAAGAVGNLSGHAVDAAAMASGAGPPAVDLPADRAA